MLALVGTYAVTAFSVGRRTREIGVRMALGADAREVRAEVLRRTLLLAGVGLGIGLVGAFAGGRLLEGLLWGVEGYPKESAIFLLQNSPLTSIRRQRASSRGDLDVIFQPIVLE